MQIHNNSEGFFKSITQVDDITLINVNEINKFNCILIEKSCEIPDKDYINFSSKFGPILSYQNKPTMSFFGQEVDEVNLHFDGISSDNPQKVPKWLIFRVRLAHNIKFGGNFEVVDTVNVINLLPEKLKDFLRSTKLEFYGYFIEQIQQQKYNEFSFSIDPIVQYNGIESLRLFLPSKNDNHKLDCKKIFKGTSEEETRNIFNELEKALRNPSVYYTLDLKENSLLILNNYFTFHGRKKFTKSVPRTFDRIQVLSHNISSLNKSDVII